MAFTAAGPHMLGMILSHCYREANRMVRWSDLSDKMPAMVTFTWL
jgi:hypothetical protein